MTEHKAGSPVRHGLARILSKRGIVSRSQAALWVRAGRVRVDGRVQHDPDMATAVDARIEIDGAIAAPCERVYLAMNKPRGLLCTRSDERGRATVYSCLDAQLGQWLAPVGRLDQASEGLLLWSNDPEWAAAITDPHCAIEKTYHVQVRPPPTPAQIAALVSGVAVMAVALPWRARSARLIRSGGKTAWLEIVLDEGRNRQIRRMLEALDLCVERLIRVAIGRVVLGDLAKGQTRALSDAEVVHLVPGKS
ncbi:MAG: pseudouridine synthase [Lysobacterales bacterium]